MVHLLTGNYLHIYGRIMDLDAHAIVLKYCVLIHTYIVLGWGCVLSSFAIIFLMRKREMVALWLLYSSCLPCVS